MSDVVAREATKWAILIGGGIALWVFVLKPALFGLPGGIADWLKGAFGDAGDWLKDDALPWVDKASKKAGDQAAKWVDNTASAVGQSKTVQSKIESAFANPGLVVPPKELAQTETTIRDAITKGASPPTADNAYNTGTVGDSFRAQAAAISTPPPTMVGPVAVGQSGTLTDQVRKADLESKAEVADSTSAAIKEQYKESGTRPKSEAEVRAKTKAALKKDVKKRPTKYAGIWLRNTFT